MKGKIIRVDIDNTICTTEGMAYRDAEPIPERIKMLNEMYDEGNILIYWTSRGVGSRMDFRELTEGQLKRWKVKYDELQMDKPVFDLLIDDKAIEAKRFLK